MVELKRFKSVARGAIRVVATLLAWPIVIPVLPVLAFFYIFKTAVILVAKVVHPKLRPLSANDLPNATDKLALSDHVKFDYERAPLNNGSTFFRLREPWTQLNMKEIQEKFQANIDKNTEYGWKLKSYLVRFCGYSFFEEIPKFCASTQIRKIHLGPNYSVHEYLNTWIMEPYPFQSALWECLVLETGLECFVAFKMHHSIADGISFIQLMEDIFGIKQHPTIQKYTNAAPKKYSILKMIFLIVSTPVLTLEYVYKCLQATDPFKVKRGIPVEQFMSTGTLNVQDVKSISKIQGVSFSSVMLTIYSGAIQRLLRFKKPLENLPHAFMIPVAQPWPGRPKNFIGNQYSVIVPQVPLSITDPIQLMDMIQKRTTHIYKSGLFTIFNHVFLNLMAIFPLWLQTQMMTSFSSKGTTALSPLLVGGHSLYDGNEFESIYVLTGITAPNFALKAMTLSFKTMLIWTVVGSRNVFESQKDLDQFTKKYIPAAFEELRSAVNKNTFSA